MASLPAISKMIHLRESRGDTKIEIGCWALHYSPGDDDAPAELRLRVSSFIKTDDGLHLDYPGGSHVTGFVSTVTHFSDPLLARRTISSALSHADSGFTVAVSPWLSDLASLASRKAEQSWSEGTGFHLSVHIRIICREELNDAAEAIDGRLHLCPDGVLCLSGGEGVETVRLSAGDDDDDDDGCPICLEGMAEEAVKIKGCSHVFHGRCLYRWFETTQSCPLCRHSAVVPRRRHS